MKVLADALAAAVILVVLTVLWVAPIVFVTAVVVLTIRWLW